MRYRLVTTLLLAAAAYPSLAQTTPPAPGHVPGAGDPLPPFSLDNTPGTTTIETGPDGRLQWVYTGGVIFTMGDVRIEADRIVVNQETWHIEAMGNVLVKRGDETLRGDYFVFDGATGFLETRRSRITSAPYYFVTDGITNRPNDLRIRSPRIGLQAGNEVHLSASEAQFANSRTVILRNASFYLFGTRLITIPRLSFDVNNDPAGGSPRTRSNVPPLTFHITQTSGIVVGSGLNFTPYRGLRGSAAVNLTTRAGIQGLLSLRHDFLGTGPREQTRLISPPPGAVRPDLASASPLRQFLAARPLPPPYDPVLDYVDILPTDNPLAQPTRPLGRDFHAEAVLTYRREFSGRRAGPVLLTRLPVVAVVAQVPLAPPIPANDNAAARAYLHTPHLITTGGGTSGYYEETRPDESGKPTTSSTRSSLAAGVGTAPVLIGSSTLLRAQAYAEAAGYGQGGSYRYSELNLSVQQVIGVRSGIGGAYILRSTSGSSPFRFDQVDAKEEAQVRGQMTVGQFSLAGLVQIDTEQKMAFNEEISVAYRHGAIEPRVSYRTLNRQLLFNIAFPGFTMR